LSFFRELNVRLYVRDRWGRPGVHFLSLDCDRAVAVWIARTCFSLPYRHATMDFGTVHEESTLTCQRRGTRLGPAVYSWSPASPPQVSEPGTVEFHLLETVSILHRATRSIAGREGQARPVHGIQRPIVAVERTAPGMEWTSPARTPPGPCPLLPGRGGRSPCPEGPDRNTSIERILRRTGARSPEDRHHGSDAAPLTTAGPSRVPAEGATPGTGFIPEPTTGPHWPRSGGRSG